MNLKFDLERAKAGEPVEMICGDNWYPIHFVGAKLDGAIVIEMRELVYYVSDYDQLRMASKKVTVRYRNFLRKELGVIAVASLTDIPPFASPEAIEQKESFMSWIHTEWQTAEVPQPDLTDKETW